MKILYRLILIIASLIWFGCVFDVEAKKPKKAETPEISTDKEKNTGLGQNKRSQNLRRVKVNKAQEATNESWGQQDLQMSGIDSILPTDSVIQQTDSPALNANRPATGVLNGHEWVDLGLPSGIKWAACNIGASTPEHPGDYYCWGEVEPTEEFNGGICKTHKKYLGDISGIVSFDVASLLWGKNWRIPRNEDFEELFINCKIAWTTYNGIYGFLITSKINGQSIFFPANLWNGEIEESEESVTIAYGLYWSATPIDNNTEESNSLEFSSVFCSGLLQVGGQISPSFRFEGLGVRPVTP